MTYQVSRNGQLYGPYTREDIERYLATGNVLPTDLAKSEEMPDWLTVSQLLAGETTPTPPPSVPSQPYFGPFANATELTGEYLFFPVSPIKFCIMSVCTFGLYHYYWAYKNWKLYQQHIDSSASPILRAIFVGIWNFPLFNRVRDKAAEEEIAAPWNPILLGVLVILFNFTGRLPHGLSLIVLLSFLVYLPVVITIDKINRKHAPAVGLPLNERFSGWNIAGVVLGGILVALSVFGTLANTTQKASQTQTTTIDVTPPS